MTDQNGAFLNYLQEDVNCERKSRCDVAATLQRRLPDREGNLSYFAFAQLDNER